MCVCVSVLLSFVASIESFATPAQICRSILNGAYATALTSTFSFDCFICGGCKYMCVCMCHVAKISRHEMSKVPVVFQLT